jgi:hypothetical protein
MCGKKNCGDCSGCGECDQPAEIKYSSQIQYDGPKIVLPGIGLTIEKCTPLNEVISILANKINELHP